MGYIVPSSLATTPEYVAWTQSTAPANIAAILRSCTTLVLKATRTAVYDTDGSTGFATDPTVRSALSDATCIQAAAWVALGINPSAGGTLQATKAVKRKKLLSAEFEYSEVEMRAVTAARVAALNDLVPEAREYLRTRGLAGSAATSHS